ncbi:hypothetical protein BX265_7139 [Streptomyces sp. TLI_235]|nr:hypothetical protein BX265_7139 [Streptomyces sp. TLI_235]
MRTSGVRVGFPPVPFCRRSRHWVSGAPSFSLTPAAPFPHRTGRAGPAAGRRDPPPRAPGGGRGGLFAAVGAAAAHQHGRRRVVRPEQGAAHRDPAHRLAPGAAHRAARLGPGALGVVPAGRAPGQNEDRKDQNEGHRHGQTVAESALPRRDSTPETIRSAGWTAPSALRPRRPWAARRRGVRPGGKHHGPAAQGAAGPSARGGESGSTGSPPGPRVARAGPVGGALQGRRPVFCIGPGDRPYGGGRCRALSAVRQPGGTHRVGAPEVAGGAGHSGGKWQCPGLLGACL